MSTCHMPNINTYVYTISFMRFLCSCYQLKRTKDKRTHYGTVDKFLKQQFCGSVSITCAMRRTGLILLPLVGLLQQVGRQVCSQTAHEICKGQISQFVYTILHRLNLAVIFLGLILLQKPTPMHYMAGFSCFLVCTKI